MNSEIITVTEDRRIVCSKCGYGKNDYPASLLGDIEKIEIHYQEEHDNAGPIQNEARE